MEEFNLELKRAEDYLQAMINAGKANKEDCQNVQMHLDNINSIVKNLTIPRVSNYVCPNCGKRGYKTDLTDNSYACKKCLTWWTNGC